MAVEFDGERMVKKEDNTLPEHPVNPLCACTAFSCNKLFLFLYAWLYLVGINSIFTTSFVLILRLLLLLFFVSSAFRRGTPGVPVDFLC